MAYNMHTLKVDGHRLTNVQMELAPIYEAIKGLAQVKGLVRGPVVVRGPECESRPSLIATSVATRHPCASPRPADGSWHTLKPNPQHVTHMHIVIPLAL